MRSLLFSPKHYNKEFTLLSKLTTKPNKTATNPRLTLAAGHLHMMGNRG